MIKRRGSRKPRRGREAPRRDKKQEKGENLCAASKVRENYRSVDACTFFCDIKRKRGEKAVPGGGGIGGEREELVGIPASMNHRQKVLGGGGGTRVLLTWEKKKKKKGVGKEGEGEGGVRKESKR